MKYMYNRRAYILIVHHMQVKRTCRGFLGDQIGWSGGFSRNGSTGGANSADERTCKRS